MARNVFLCVRSPLERAWILTAWNTGRGIGERGENKKTIPYKHLSELAQMNRYTYLEKK